MNLTTASMNPQLPPQAPTRMTRLVPSDPARTLEKSLLLNPKSLTNYLGARIDSPNTDVNWTGFHRRQETGTRIS